MNDFETDDFYVSYSTRYTVTIAPRTAKTNAEIIRLTGDDKAVLEEQANKIIEKLK